ncbi:hypothetical protein BH23GEM5_BH23GEM5_25190 [soil metagenome]
MDEYFIENRTRLLDVAAFLDRLDPAHVIANRAAEAMGTELTPRQPHPAGIGVHYGLGIMPAAGYGVLRHQVPAIPTAGGMLNGGDVSSLAGVVGWWACSRAGFSAAGPPL